LTPDKSINTAGLNTGAYVLNALDENERKEFETHLAESEEIRNEVTELSDTAVMLGMAAAPVQPSPELKSNLMAMLANTPQLPKDVAPVRTLQAVAPAPSTATDDAPPAALSSTNNKAQARWFNRPVVALTAVAAAIALIVGGGVVANVVSDANFQQAQTEQYVSITAASDMQTAEAVVASGGFAKLVWSEELGQSALVVNGLEALPDNKVYELWYIDGEGNATAAGLFDHDDSWRVLEGEMQAGDTVGVTIEPNGGSTSPTTDPIIAIASA